MLKFLNELRKVAIIVGHALVPTVAALMFGPMGVFGWVIGVILVMVLMWTIDAEFMAEVWFIDLTLPSVMLAVLSVGLIYSGTAVRDNFDALWEEM